MSGRFWALATAVLGLAALAVFVTFALLPQARAADACMATGAMVQFELARDGRC